MSQTDELQQQFDRALASITVADPSPQGLHQRVRRRRMRRRVVGGAGLAAVASLGLLVGLTGTNTAPAAAVTLVAQHDSALTRGELRADALIIENRLDAIGDRTAHVTVSGSTIVVTGGTVDLAHHRSALTESPALLARRAICESGPYRPSPASPQPGLPTSCSSSRYVLLPVITSNFPGGAQGYTSASPLPDPALAGYPTTTPTADGADPNSVALLPATYAKGTRYLVGPAQLTLSSAVASASVVQPLRGTWGVDIHLSPSESARLDDVAHQDFHQVLAIDLNGQVVAAPLIQPAQKAFTSFDGKMVLSGFASKAVAEDVAAALKSGPLPIPLRVGHR
jgi:hypothetical protein